LTTPKKNTPQKIQEKENKEKFASSFLFAFFCCVSRVYFRLRLSRVCVCIVRGANVGSALAGTTRLVEVSAGAAVTLLFFRFFRELLGCVVMCGGGGL